MHAGPEVPPREPTVGADAEKEDGDDMGFLGLGAFEALILAGTGIGAIALVAVGAAVVKLAFWGPARRRDDES